MIPGQPDASGFPTAGCHAVSWQDVCRAYVPPAPESRRRRIAGGLVLWRHAIFEIAGELPVLLGGDFISAVDEPDCVVAVALCPDRWVQQKLTASANAAELFTMKDVGFVEPFMGWSPAVRPMAGLVEAYSASPASLAGWDDLLSRPEPGEQARRGYLWVDPR